MMKLGIIGPPNENGYKLAHDKNLAFIEHCINVDADYKKFIDSVEELKALSKKYNVSVGSIGRWGSDKIDENGNIIEEELQANLGLIDAAAALGCPVFNTGVNYVESLSYYQNISCAIEYLQKVVDHGKAKGVKVATYNCHWNNYIVEPAVWKLVHGHIKDLGIKFDPSHAVNAGIDYLTNMVDWGDRFYHVHIKGTLNIDGRHIDDPPAGLDMINWGAFMSLLYKRGYDGNLSLEPHSSTWKDELGDKGLDYSIEYMSKLIF